MFKTEEKKNSEEFCVMALKGDAKFKRKLIPGLKNVKRNLHFDVLLLSITYKGSAKKLQKSYLS